MPLQATSGAASYDAFGGGVPVEPNYIESVFSTFLYTGNGSTQTINNGIDLAGKGGLVWIKRRDAVRNHQLFDTVRGATKILYSDLTNAQDTDVTSLTSFNSNGFSLGLDGGGNANGGTYASWTFREQPKFFDVVTYTGNGSTTGQMINHNLGSRPGTIIIKRTDATSDWIVASRVSDTMYSYGLRLNSTAAQEGTYAYSFSEINSTQFTTFISNNGLDTNVSGGTYVAYLFAHNAGGFGLSGTDNVISCGSFTTDSIGIASVTLGYEPQWLMVKRSDGVNNWTMKDVLRGSLTATVSGISAANLRANTADAESTNSNVNGFSATATGFYSNGNETTGSATYIYIAIRRGPMRTPTTGTSVFSPNTQTGAGTSAGQTITTNFPVDLEISSGRSDNSGGNAFVDRLRGGQNYIQATNTNAEVNFTSWTPLIGFANNTGITDANYGSTSASYVAWNFRRAPGFFDVVCYTASSSQLTLNHNLGVVPEMIITKARSNADDWYVWCQHNSSIATGACISLNSNASTASAGGGSLSSFTASSFNTFLPGINGWTVVSYLFASAPGVSKVGSFTGTGATQTINCGFTAGARFVLIKATSTTGNWLVWDSARGIVAGNDPYLALNSTAAEVTNTDWVDTAATGFELSNAGGNLANSNGVSYIFWAVA